MRREVILVIFLLSSQLFATHISSDTNLLKSHVNTLVNTSEPRNYTNTNVLDSIAYYLKNEFKIYGFENVLEQKYEVKGKIYKNIIASVGPQNTAVIVIGAHYDVFGDLPGADDNASGVAGLLECARLVYANKAALKNRIEFVAYTLEEPPFFNTRFMGSYLHASYLTANNVKVKYMICLEMIGYYSEEKNSQEYPLGILKPLYGSKGNYITCVSNFNSRKFTLQINKTFNRYTNIESKYLIAPSFIKGINFSDHRNYWAYKMPAIMLTDGAFFRNKNYHTINDTTDHLNYGKMKDVVDGIVLFILQHR